MRWFAALRTAAGGVARHKVQAVVIVVVLLVSTASATLSLALLSAANAPFQHAFSAQRGADATLTIDSSKVDSRKLAGAGTLKGVTAVSGPFPESTVELSFDGNQLGPRVLAGRDSPSGAVDDIVLSAGHWPDGPGQVVLYSGLTGGPGYPQVGNIVTIGGAPEVHSLTVVGFATSITKTADGWVTPAEATELQTPGVAPTAQMLFRFHSAGSEDQVRADVAEIARSLPDGSVVSAASWLTAERIAAGDAAIMQPFIVAFALIGLVMAVLIVGNLVSGAVVAQYQRIGVLKSVGLTPTQIVVAYLGRIGSPALVGSLLGAVVGSLAAAPVLNKSSGIYGVGRPEVPWWAPMAALAAMLVLTALAALGPAVRAGRLSAVQAISSGRAPQSGHGYAAHRLTSRLRLPRPVGIGLAAPFARPARTAVTLAAIALGATAVIFAVGLNSGLNRAEQAATLSAASPVQVQLANSQTAPTAAQAVAATAALRAQPATRRFVAVYGPGPGESARVPGISDDVAVQAFGSNADWLGFAQIAGRWYRSPGEVDVNTTFLGDSGLSVGDTATVDIIGSRTAPATVRIVGEVFDPSNNPWLFASTKALPTLSVPEDLQGYDVGLASGANTSVYIQGLNDALGPNSPWSAGTPHGSQFYSLAAGLIALLAIMVAIGAGLGVLNTVLMGTKDRVHDLGIFKVIGMRPGQIVTMVICWIAGPALLAALIAVPAAITLTNATVHAMGNTAHSGIPASFTQVFPVSRLALLSLAALAIALLGALLPACWAARSRPMSALRAE